MEAIVTPGQVTRATREPNDRRIGRRVPTSDMVIDWQPPMVKEPSRFGRWRCQGAQPSRAEVLDLSVSGAKVAVEGPDLPVGAKVDIFLDGAAGIASVRRIMDSSVGRSIYGIQFLMLDPALERRVAGLLTGNRGYLEARWNRAR